MCIRDRYQNTLSQQLSPKASSIHDHMYCVTAWDGLPLYRYSMMEKLSEAYESSQIGRASCRERVLRLV